MGTNGIQSEHEIVCIGKGFGSLRRSRIDIIGCIWILFVSLLRRHGQVGKAMVCKTMYPRFESGCRLHFFLSPEFNGVIVYLV